MTHETARMAYDAYSLSNAVPHDVWLSMNQPSPEVRESVPLEVRGRLPAGVRGVHWLVGPNGLTDPDDSYISGHAMIHEVRFAEGRATYRNRFVETEDLRAALSGRSLTRGSFKDMFARSTASLILHNATRRPLNTLRGLLALDPMRLLGLRVPPNINVFRWGGRFFCTADGTVPWEVTADLDTLPQACLPAALKRPLMPHPAIDAAREQLVVVSHDRLARGWIHCLDRRFQKQLAVCYAPTPGTALSHHDIAVTDSYFVLSDIALEIGLTRPVGFADAASILIVPRPERDGAVRALRVPLPFPGYVVPHIICAREDEARLVVSMEVVSIAGLKAVIAGRIEDFLALADDDLRGFVTVTLEPRPDGCRILDMRESVARHLQSATDEAPGRPATSVLGGGSSGGMAMIYRTRIDSGETQEWPVGVGLPQQASYIPPPSGHGVEGAEGWFVEIVSSPQGSRALVFDMTSVATGPVAEMDLPVGVPFCVHSAFWPAP